MAMRRSHYCVGFAVLLFTVAVWLYSLPLPLREELASWRASAPYPPPAADSADTSLLTDLPDVYIERPDGSLTGGFLEDDDESFSHAPNKSTSIHHLWFSKWAKAYNAARPMAEPIEISRAYGTNGASPNDRSPRRPVNNRVKNDNRDIVDLQLAHSAFVQSLKKMEKGDDYFKGRGIVTLGGLEYFGPAIIGLHMLRSAGSTLPVEVFVGERDEYETAICDDYLPKLNAKCLVIADILYAEETDAPPVTHYQLKSLAILFSSFAEVLYLDSDSIPLVNPDTELFGTEPFTSTGFVSWPDFWLASESPLFYNIAGIPFPKKMPNRSSESGQILINKKTHIETLLLTTYYNFYGPKYYYPLLSQGALGEGDKETFLAAAVVLGETYYRVNAPVKSVNRFNNGHKVSGMVQHHPGDDMQGKARPAFLHANTPKANAGHLVDEGDLITGDNKHIRLWGKKEEQMKQFGFDVEEKVWKLLVQTGCELAGTIEEWKKRERMCERLKEHYKAVFV